MYKVLVISGGVLKGKTLEGIESVSTNVIEFSARTYADVAIENINKARENSRFNVEAIALYSEKVGE